MHRVPDKSQYQRQMWSVQDLEIPPRSDCTLTRFEVEEIGKLVLVFRSWSPLHAPSLRYSDSIRVGVRGGCKVISKIHD